jgi:TonB family protein
VLKVAGPNLQLPWYASLDEDGRFKKILGVSFAIFALFAVAVPFIPVPELTREERETLPPQLARVVLEKKEIPKPPPPPPPPQPKEEEKPKPVEEKKPEEKPKPPEPKPEPPKPIDRVAEAKEKAATSGLLQFQDDLADMRDALDLAKVDSANLSRGENVAAKVDRSVITSGAKSTSGGINTAALSRDTGGVALSGRETTKVESALATRTGSGDNEGGEGARGGSSRSDEEIRQIMDRNKDAIFAIYNRALRRNPGLQGKVTVQLTIEPTGQITAVKIVSSELNDEDLESKLLARIQLISFNATSAARTVVNYSFDFLPY